MKILFMGTPGPAAQCLKALIDKGHDITAVITQPDRGKGRGLEISKPPVKVDAEENHIPVHQPEDIKDRSAIELVKKIGPELIVVVAYGKIIPEEIINAPRYGSINVHASLLPKYRGAAPIQWAIINGDKKTGITIQKVAYKLDSGDIILQEEVNIDGSDNTVTLTSKLFIVGARLLVKAIEQIEKGKARNVKQDESKVTHAPLLKKETGLIDWNKTSRELFNLIRGCYPWPGAFTYYKGKILKIIKAEQKAMEGGAEGKILEVVKNKGFVVGTGEGALLITEVQPESGKKMSAWEFLAGHELKAGDTLPC